MKKILILSLIAFSVISCNKKSKVEKKVAEIPAEVKVERFDKSFQNKLNIKF